MLFRSSRAIAIVCSAAVAACSPGGQTSRNPLPSEDDAGGKATPNAVGCPSRLVVKPRLQRLTHRQYRNTLRDLLGDETSAVGAMTLDPSLTRFSNNDETLFVPGPLARDYQRVAEAAGQKLMRDPMTRGKLVPCSPTEASCSAAFVRSFGAKAFRRPLTEPEQTSFEALFRAAQMDGTADEAFANGVSWVVQAMLMSPQFIYRSALQDISVGQNARLPEPYALASSLSYLLWNSMPDDELFEAARQGHLSARRDIETQVKRMLSDPRADDVVGDFHAQFMATNAYLDLQRDPKLSKEFGADLGPAFDNEVQLFARHVFHKNLGFESLLTSTTTFANRRMAKLYGVPINAASDTEMVQVELDANQRAGLLTQLGFLASHAHADATAPVLRGAFVLRNILCMQTPAPPADVDTTLPPLEAGMTTRDLIAKQTAAPACNGCHQLINPPGFAFEGFDGVGQRRTTDNGQPVNTQGSVSLEKGDVGFANALELIRGIAQSDEAKSCYGSAWLNYALARSLTSDDECAVQAVTDAIKSKELPLVELLANIATSDAFLFHRDETEAP